MTDDDHLEQIREAVQAYINDGGDDPPLVVTDFAIGYAAIDMHTADAGNVLGSVTLGARHSTLGLAHILVHDLTDLGDDE